MSFLVLIPFALVAAPFIPTLIENAKRKDKGPKEVPEQTTYEEKPDLDVPRLERARGEARVKEPGEVIRVVGDVTIPDGTEIDNHLVVQGHLKLGRKCHVYGSLKAIGDVEIGESSIIEGHVLSEGRIVIGRNCIIKGVVDSLKEITIGEGTVVEAVSTEKTVNLGPGAKINRRVLSGVSIISSAEQLQVPKVPEAEVAPIPPPEQPPVVFERVQLPQPVEEKPVEKKPAFPFEALDSEVGNLFFYAPTGYGKTFMIQKYVIPHLEDKKKIVVIDPQREYPFEPYEIKYDKTIPDVESDLFKSFITFDIWNDVDPIIKEMINRIGQSKGNLSIRLNIVDNNVEKLIVSEFLKRTTKIRWKTPILLIVEDAEKYDVVSVVTRAKQANIQVILTSDKKPVPEIFSNSHMVLGRITPSLIEDYDPKAAEAITDLGEFEFVWEKTPHDWRRFRLDMGTQYPELEVSEITEEETPAIKEEKPIFRRVKPPAPIVYPPIPRFELPKTKKPEKKTEEVTDQIFGYLEDRIRRIDKIERRSIEGISLEGLTPIEVKVFKLVCGGSSLEEVSLRLLMDPLEVQEILNGLIEKGYFDEDLKPKKPEAKPEKEEAVSVETPESEGEPEGEVFDSLIASKMREELKRKVSVETEEAPIDEEPEQEEKEEVSGEFRRVDLRKKFGKREDDK